MSLFKKIFLYTVGAVVVAYEETSKVVNKQLGRVEKRVNRARAH